MRHLLKLSVISLCLGTGLSQEAPSQEQTDTDSKNCVGALTACTTAAATLSGGIVGQLKACKPLRECKKRCRDDKGDCKDEARAEKQDCKEECKDEYGSGKEFRDCKQDCRQGKRAEKRVCREDKRECKDVCRDTLKSGECQTARKAVLGSAVVAVPACIQFAACVASDSGEEEGATQ